MVIGETDPEAKDFVEPFETQLNDAGWRKGLNLEITYRWGASNPERLHLYAKELVDSAPDILLAFGTAALIPLHKATTTIPIVFVAISDPVGQGFVASVRRPGGNMTGFSNFDPDIGSKWLQLLKDIAPSVTNVTVMFNSNTSPYNALWMRSIETAAPGFGMSSVQASIQDEEDIRKTITLLAMKPGGGLIVPSDSFTYERSTLVASVAASNRLPAIYAFARFAHAGGLIAYGINMAEQFGKAAGYVDRILKGAKAGELPVQAPTRYTMTINLKTAKALGLTIPETLLATADQVIE
jgi:putative ABC transport system substrate-binding protein